MGLIMYANATTKMTIDLSGITTDNAINRQSNIFSIRKHKFNPVINLKGGIAYWALGFTWRRIYALF